MKMIKTNIQLELIERWALGMCLDDKELKTISSLENKWEGFAGGLDHHKMTKKSLYLYDRGCKGKDNSVCFRKQEDLLENED